MNKSCHISNLKFLLVHRKVAGFDVEQTSATEAQHVLTLAVPRHAVRVRLLRKEERKHDKCAMNIRTVLVISNLEEKFLGVDVVDETSVVLIHHCQSIK